MLSPIAIGFPFLCVYVSVCVSLYVCLSVTSGRAGRTLAKIKNVKNDFSRFCHLRSNGVIAELYSVTLT